MKCSKCRRPMHWHNVLGIWLCSWSYCTGNTALSVTWGASSRKVS